MRKSEWMLLYTSHIERLDYEARALGMDGVLPPKETPPRSSRPKMVEFGLIARDRLPLDWRFDPLAEVEGAPEPPEHLTGYTRDEPELSDNAAYALIEKLKLPDPWHRMPRGFARRQG